VRLGEGLHSFDELSSEPSGGACDKEYFSGHFYEMVVKVLGERGWISDFTRDIYRVG
jgi:hypothetical protein